MDSLQQSIEQIFRTSSSNDDLFDSFRLAIESKIDDAELYKILLLNKSLSYDEILMYAEKICREFPKNRFSIYMAVGQLFSSISFYGKYNDIAFKYLLKAAEEEPKDHTPYLAIIMMYSSEVNSPSLEMIIEAVLSGIQKVEKKSKLCFALMKLYENQGVSSKARVYQKMGEKYQKEGK